MNPTIKLVNILPENYTLAIRAVKSFEKEGKPVGVWHGTIYWYGETDDENCMDDGVQFYVYRTKTMVVIRGS